MNKKLRILSLIVLFFGILLFSNNSYCADGSLKASQSKSGDKITVTVTSTKSLGAFTLKASGLTSISGSSSVGDWGNNIIAGATASGTTTLGKFVFKVPEKDAKVSFSVTGVEDKDGKALEISSTSLTLKANTTSNNAGNTGNNNNSSSSTTTTKKSTNANLSTLGVTPKEYDFSGFSKSKTSYSVTIPNNVDSLKVVYKTEDSKASVKVSGDSGFETGSNNEIKVVVTAEDGKTTKTYTIKVTKLAEDTEKPGNIIDDDKNDGLYLTSLTIKGIELSPKFAKDTYSYTATLDDASVNELKVEAKANNEKANIAISGNTNLEDGENTINIILTLDDSSEQTIYQVVVTKEAVALPTTISSETTPTSNNDFMGSIKTYLWIIIAVIVLVVVAVIVLIILLRRENKRLRDEDMDDEEYNVYKNDANEFQSKNEDFIASLYKQKDENSSEEELTQEDKETLEEINRQTNDIFKDKVQGQSVEYSEEELEERKNRKDKGRHF